MLIKLSPRRFDAELAVTKQGDKLTINGMTLDFTPLADGASLPASAISSEWVVGGVERAAGDLVLTLCLPHWPDAAEAVRFPADIVNPKNGAVNLPTGIGVQPATAAPGVIDWSQVVTAEMKAERVAAQLLATAQAETATRRASADSAIAPLQDAVDLDEATEAEAARLKDWKRYRVALNRLPEQPGYPNDIDWPAPPA